jgi:hypothetical protein
LETSKAFGHLAGWTPINLHASEGRLSWADLRSYRFDAVDLNQTIEAWRSAGGMEVSSDVAALDALDDERSLTPTLIIAQLSRCGSTLLCNMLRCLQGTLVVSEPSVLFRALYFAAAQRGDGAAIDVVRKLVRALGRIRFGDERYLVLKLSSYATPLVPTLRRAFPDTPLVWLQRDPEAVIRSNLEVPPKWLSAKTGPDVDRLTRHVIRACAVHLMAANGMADSDMTVLDYRELPDAVPTQIVPLLGIVPTQEELARMGQAAQLDAKTGTPFRARDRMALHLPTWAETAIAQSLQPLYCALDRRRATPTAPVR